MKLLTPAVRCSHCGAEPPTRITEQDKEKYLTDDPGRFAGTFRCSRCSKLTKVTCEAYQRAA